jgi:hypothetical protein
VLNLTTRVKSNCKAYGKDDREGYYTCKHCGAKADMPSALNIPERTRPMTDDEYLTFVGRNSDKYLPKFRKFSMLGEDKFVLTWHWPAFFFGPLWMFYRKLYLWGVIGVLAGVVGMLLSGFPIPMLATFVGMFYLPLVLTSWTTLPFFPVAWGVTGYYLYYRHAKKTIQSVSVDLPPQDAATAIGQVGGVHRWLANTCVVILLCLFVTLIIVMCREYKIRKDIIRDRENRKQTSEVKDPGAAREFGSGTTVKLPPSKL